MENNYTVEVTTDSGLKFTEKVKALNELEALDIVHEMWSNLNILDIKVVENK